MAHVGQRVVYRLATSDYRSARITKIVSGTTVNLVAFTTGDEWFSGVPGDIPAYYMSDVALGTAVGTWQEATGVDPAVSAEIDSDVAAEGRRATTTRSRRRERAPSRSTTSTRPRSSS